MKCIIHTRDITCILAPCIHQREKLIKCQRHKLLRGLGGMSPQESFILRGSEMPFPTFFQGNIKKYHDGKKENNLLL